MHVSSLALPLTELYCIVVPCAAVRARTKAFPATAQVASQQGEYLAKRLNGLARQPDATDAPFNYRHLGQLAYIGGESAAVDLGGGHNISGWGTPPHSHTNIHMHTCCMHRLQLGRTWRE